jgi:uncharacterized protein (TIGR02466 family)
MIRRAGNLERPPGLEPLAPRPLKIVKSSFMAPPFAKTNVLPVFPSFIWKAELAAETREAIRARLAPWLQEAMHAEPPLEPGESWQSGHDLHRLEAFRDLVAAVDRLARSVLGFLKIADATLVITGLWANVNAPGAGHPRHSHPNNFLSGAYYVDVAPGADSINFHDPRVQASVVRPPVTDLTGENADQAVVQVETGSLIMFPAWLEHSVDPNRSKGRRISLSYNMMFALYAETLSRPLWEGGRRRLPLGD